MDEKTLLKDQIIYNLKYLRDLIQPEFVYDNTPELELIDKLLKQIDSIDEICKNCEYWKQKTENKKNST